MFNIDSSIEWVQEHIVAHTPELVLVSIVDRISAICNYLRSCICRREVIVGRAPVRMHYGDIETYITDQRTGLFPGIISRAAAHEIVGQIHVDLTVILG